MTTSSRLAAHQAAKTATHGVDQDPPRQDDEEDETTPKSKKKDKEMTEEETNALKAEAKAEGIKETNARMNAVFASTEYAGREKLAHSLLATSLSAEEIGVQLAAAPKIEPSAIAAPLISQEASDEAARKVMAAAIATTANAAIDLGSGAPEAEADPKKNAVDNILNAQRQFGSQAPRAQTK